MSARGVVASLSRTAPAIAALVIAVSVTIALGVMIGSFRSTVERWLDHTLRADVYVSPPGLVSSRTDAVLDPSLIRLLSGAPGVAAVTTYRGVTVEGGSGPVQLVALELDPRTREAFSFRDGVAREVWRAWEAGNAVLVSESYAYRHDLRVGSALSLRTDAGPASFDVAGVFADYGNDQGVVMMPRAEYDRYWDDPAISSLGLFALPGTDVERLVQELRGVPGPGQEVLIRSNRTLREISLEVFDRTFVITAVLRLLAFVVAFIGVLSALMALQLERSRELGVMRANGLTPGQVWQLVTSQTGLIGLAAGLLSLPVGATIAAIMIHVVNRRAFGWTLQMEMPPALFGQAIGIALGAALLAGLYPAYRMARTSPARALREE